MNETCKQPREDLLLFIEATEFNRDGASEEQCAEIAGHLEFCEICRAETDRIRADLFELHNSPTPPVPKNLHALIRNRIRESRKPPARYRIPAWAFASVAVVLIAVVFSLPKEQPENRPAAPQETAELAKLLDEQERWIVILGSTLQDMKNPEHERLYEAGTYVVSRLDRTTDALRQAIHEGGLDPRMTSEYQQRVRQQIDLLKNIYFESSSS